MACERVGEAVTCVPPSDGNTVFWDTGGSSLWVWTFGSVAEWATAIVAILAVGAAWAASTRSHKLQADLNRLEQDREDRADLERARRADADKRGLQADVVAAWKSPNPYAGGTNEHRRHESRVLVRNGSPLPIFSVQILIFNRSGDEVRLHHGVPDLPPGDTEIGIPNIPFKTMKVKNSDRMVVDIPERWEHVKVGVRFMDTAGSVWLRDAHGTLHLEKERNEAPGEG